MATLAIVLLVLVVLAVMGKKGSQPPRRPAPRSTARPPAPAPRAEATRSEAADVIGGWLIGHHIAHGYDGFPVIHFTGRRGVDREDVRVRDEDDRGRLRGAMQRRQLLGFAIPELGRKRSASRRPPLKAARGSSDPGDTRPAGLAFRKRYLFEHGGGPVLQVRGDQWAAVARWPPHVSDLSDSLRRRKGDPSD